MNCSVQLGCHQDIGQGIIVCVDAKGQSVKVFMELFDHNPPESEKLQCVGRVVRFGLCQTPTGIGDDGIHTIVMNVIEDSPKPDPQASEWG